jgi:prepilin-type N-terminal cleavage/methylation domain-containing protein
VDKFHERMRNRGQGGFTLIELLVVVAILAILGGVAVFAVGNLTGEAEESACVIELRTIKTAIEAHRADNNGDYPASAADLIPDWLESAPTEVTITYSGNPAVAPTLSPATAAGC